MKIKFFDCESEALQFFENSSLIGSTPAILYRKTETNVSSFKLIIILLNYKKFRTLSLSPGTFVDNKSTISSSTNSDGSPFIIKTCP